MEFPQNEIDDCIDYILQEKNQTTKKLFIYLMCKELLDDDYHNQNGAILYSTIDTIKRGDYFIMGYNPGGAPDKMDDREHQIMPKLLHQLQDDAKNEYVHGDWGNSKIQNNLIKFFIDLEQPIEQTCATNLIFRRSKDDSGVKYSESKKCWRVNKLFLDIVQPKIIITNGNSEEKSAYKFLRHHLWSTNSRQEFIELPDLDYKVKTFSFQRRKMAASNSCGRFSAF